MIVLRIRRHYQSQQINSNVAQLKKQPVVKKVRITPHPELSIDKTILRLLPDQSPRVILQITNRGNETAFNLAIPSGMILQPLSFNGALPECDEEVKDIHPEIAPGATVSSISMLELLISDEMYRYIDAGNLRFFYYFKGRYEDRAGKTYPLNRIYMYDHVL